MSRLWGSGRWLVFIRRWCSFPQSTGEPLQVWAAMGEATQHKYFHLNFGAGSRSVQFYCVWYSLVSPASPAPGFSSLKGRAKWIQAVISGFPFMVPLPAHGRIHTCREFTLFFLKLLRICYSRSFFFLRFVYFWLCLGLCCFLWLSVVAVTGDCSILVCGLLTVVAALLRRRTGFRVRGLSCPTVCGIFVDQGSHPCPLYWQVDS